MRILLLFLLLAIGGQVLTEQTVLADSLEVTVSLASITVHTNERFVVPISISAPEGFAFTSYEFVLTYDPEIITFDTLLATQTLSASSLLSYNQAEPGVIGVAAANGQSIEANGVLVNVVFTSPNHVGNSSLEFNSFNIDEDLIRPVVHRGLVEVLDSPPETVRIMLDSATVHTQDAFALGLYVDNASRSLQSGMISLSYDPGMISPAGILLEHTALGAVHGFTDFNSSTPGNLDIVFASSSPIFSGEMPLVYLAFESLNTPGESIISLTNATFDEHNFLASFEHGRVYITSPFLPGDPSGDQMISWFDARLILWHVSGKNHLQGASLLAADVSANRMVSSYDAALVLMYLHGMLACFPADTSCLDAASKPMESAIDGLHVDAEDIFVLTPDFLNNYTLSLDLSSPILPPIHSLDLSVTMSLPDTSAFRMSSSIPGDWMYTMHTTSTEVIISMAGATALSPGPILSLNQHASDGYDSIQIQVNGRRLYSIALPVSLESNMDVADLNVYPNPFSSDAALTYILPEDSMVEIIVYDALGRLIRRLHRAERQAGVHELILDGAGLPSGFYSLHLIPMPGKRLIKNVIKQ